MAFQPLVRGSTFEKITLRDTILGAMLFWLAMLALRVAALLYIITWALVTGRGAGWLILAVVFVALQDVNVASVVPPVYSISFDSEKHRQHRKPVAVAVLIGAALCVLHLSGVWPHLWWDHLQYSEEYWLYLTGDTFQWGIPTLVVWLRFVFIVASAWVIWTPSKLLDWTLKTEQTYPKQREMPVAPADPGSLTGPNGEPYAQGRKVTDAPPTVVITNKPNEGGAL